MNKIKQPKNEGDMYVIYSRWLAAKLRDAGFPIIKVKANPRKPEFDCYLFENSSEFQEMLTEISKSKE